MTGANLGLFPSPLQNRLSNESAKLSHDGGIAKKINSLVLAPSAVSEEDLVRERVVNFL